MTNFSSNNLMFPLMVSLSRNKKSVKRSKRVSAAFMASMTSAGPMQSAINTMQFIDHEKAKAEKTAAVGQVAELKQVNDNLQFGYQRLKNEVDDLKLKLEGAHSGKSILEALEPIINDLDKGNNDAATSALKSFKELLTKTQDNCAPSTSSTSIVGYRPQ